LKISQIFLEETAYINAAKKIHGGINDEKKKMNQLKEKEDRKIQAKLDEIQTKYFNV